MVEQDKPKNGMILMYVVGIIAFLVVTVVIIDQYIKSTMHAEYKREVLEAPTNDLRSLHASEDTRRHSSA
jgi:hypothetical protein